MECYGHVVRLLLHTSLHIYEGGHPPRLHLQVCSHPQTAGKHASHPIMLANTPTRPDNKAAIRLTGLAKFGGFNYISRLPKCTEPAVAPLIYC